MERRWVRAAILGEHSLVPKRRQDSWQPRTPMRLSAACLSALTTGVRLTGYHLTRLCASSQPVATAACAAACEAP